MSATAGGDKCDAEAPVPKKAKPDQDEPKINGDAANNKALEEIDSCQTEIDKLNEKCSEEILLVEQKFNKQRRPLFDQRSKLIEKVPNFWVTAFINHPQISAIVDEDEEECLHYLSSVEVEEFEDIKSGYRLKFKFEANPFFKNTQIVKEFKLEAEPSCTCTPIEWKDGMNLVERAKKAHQSAGGPPGETRTFFLWLGDATEPDDIAEVIKDDVWPNPLQYFLVPDGDDDDAADEDLGDDDDDDEDLDEEADADDADDGDGGQ